MAVGSGTIANVFYSDNDRLAVRSATGIAIAGGGTTRRGYDGGGSLTQGNNNLIIHKNTSTGLNTGAAVGGGDTTLRNTSVFVRTNNGLAFSTNGTNVNSVLRSYNSNVSN